MRRAIGAGVCVCLAAAAAGTARAGECDVRSWVAGAVEVCQGSVIYRDYVYDDYGADTGAVGASSTGSLSNPAGDERYANSGENSADLVSLRLAKREGEEVIDVTAVLNSRTRPGSKTTLLIAVDGDGDASTGGGQWGDFAVSSAGWDLPLHEFATTGETDTISGSFPVPSAESWRVQAATATTDGTVMNVAFRGAGETGTWWESKQAAALRARDVSVFGHVVRTAWLSPSVTIHDDGGAGLHERVYVSDWAIGDGQGVSYEGVPGPTPPATAFGQEFHFLGRNQPYGIYIPNRDTPHGLQLVMHGYSANHSSLIQQGGMQRNIGEALNRILVVPLARGPAGFYSGYSEQDVLDVIEDVRESYDVDEDRVFSGGYSMGGYGTFRFAALHPHLFAGYISWVGFPGEAFPGTPLQNQPGSSVGALGNMLPLFRNFRWLPGASLYAGLDELVNVVQGLGVAQALRETGHPYEFFFHPAAEHLTLAVLDDWRKEADYTRDLVRKSRPPRVTFRTDTAVDTALPPIRHDRAYWVSEIRGRSNPGFIDVDLTTHGCGGEVPFTSPTRDVGLDPVPWVSEGADVARAAIVEPGNRITGTLANVESLTIDADATCLEEDADLTGIARDGPVTITLVSGNQTIDTVTLP